VPRFRLNIGGDPIEFDSADATGFLDAWGEVSRSWSSDPDRWRRTAAALACDWSGKTVRFDNDESFALDMMRHGMLEEIEHVQG